jgi:hypothetical protein
MRTEFTLVMNESMPKPVHLSTVKRHLNEANLFGRAAIKKPLLHIQNKRKRLQWTKKHQQWTLRQWEKVLWSDEFKFDSRSVHV